MELMSCFKEQRYKLFESNSQQAVIATETKVCCFKEQRYKLFESNSQLLRDDLLPLTVVSKSKDTSYLKAIHNYDSRFVTRINVVSKSKDTSYLKAIHNYTYK